MPLGEGRQTTKKSLSRGTGYDHLMVKLIDEMPAKEGEVRGWIDALTGSYDDRSP